MPLKMLPSDITKETSLWQLYRLSYKFPISAFNVVVSGIVAAMVICTCALFNVPGSVLVTGLRKTAEFGIGFAPAVLGFLVAGFTIFISITKLDIFVAMSQTEYEETGESFLKHNLSAFTVVFIHYTAYVFCLVLYVIFCPPGGIASVILSHLDDKKMLEYGLAAFFAGAAGWSIYLVLLLKSFIYNTYQSVVTSVRWELVKPSLPVTGDTQNVLPGSGGNSGG